jgi:hypothetical protein
MSARRSLPASPQYAARPRTWPARSVDYEVLAVVVDPVRDMRGSPAVVHEHWGDNLYLERTIEGGDIEAARAAEVTVTRHYRMNRQSGAPLEGRAVLAYREPTRLARPYHRATAARKSGSQVTPRWRGQSGANSSRRAAPTPPIKGQFHRRSDEFLESIKRGSKTPAENKIILHNFDVLPGVETHSWKIGWRGSSYCCYRHAYLRYYSNYKLTNVEFGHRLPDILTRHGTLDCTAARQCYSAREP